MSSGQAEKSRTYFECLKEIENLLKSKFGNDAKYESETLMADYLEISKPKLYTLKEKRLNEGEYLKLLELALKRAQGVPLQYLLGWTEFLGLRFFVNSDVLIPRLDSESMVMEAVEYLKSIKIKSPQILDLGAGSGALGMSLLHFLPDAELVAVDTSPRALSVLKKNSVHLGLQNRLKALELDLDKESSYIQLSQMKSKFDLILANPPYIDPSDPDLDSKVKNYEPALALFASELGLEKIIKWSQKSTDLLSSKGIYFCEMGWKQGPKVATWFEQNLSSQFKFLLHKDLSGNERYFSLKRI